MKKWVKIFIIIFINLIFLFLLYLIFFRSYPFSGYVYDADTKEPVEGALVKVSSCWQDSGYGCQTVFSYTDSDGKFKGRTGYNYRDLRSVEKEGYYYYGPFLFYNGTLDEIYLPKLNSTSDPTIPPGSFVLKPVS